MKSDGYLVRALPSDAAFAGYPGAVRSANGRSLEGVADAGTSELPLAPSQTLPEGPLGRHSDERYAARRQARETRLRAAENRDKLGSDQQLDTSHPQMRRGNAGAASAPQLLASQLQPPLAAPTREEMDQQKLRLASKMEMLGLFDGYSKSIGKITLDNNKLLRSKLRGCNEVAVANAGQQSGMLRDIEVQEWTDRSANTEKSMKRQLKLVDDFVCKNLGLAC